MTSSKSKIKKFIDTLIGLLALAKWIPFLGKWRELLLALSAVLATISGLLAKCEVTETNHTPTPTPTTSPIPTQIPTILPTPTLTPSPTPKPTPRPPKIMIDRAVVALHPFTVRWTAPFEYNTHLWADKYRLGTMGKDVDGTHVLYAVVLNTPGKRRLTVRNKAGEILAEQIVEVSN